MVFLKNQTLAIIPARGGSKGIPGKNLKLIAGISLIERAIEQAQIAQKVDKVAVSTDDPQIASVTRMRGVTVIERPEHISGDQASSESAILHALQSLKESENFEPTAIAFIQCTAPLLTAADIDGTLALVLSGGYDSGLAVTPFHHFLWKEGTDGAAEGINHNTLERLRRQDLTDQKPQFLEAGSVYVMKTQGFVKCKHRFFGRVGMHSISACRNIEIDEPADLVIAEALARVEESHRRRKLLPQKIGALVFDFDGVFTDNRVYVSQDGSEMVACSRSDGWGLGKIKQSGFPTIVLSTEKNPVVKARCHKLEIECVQEVDGKLDYLRDWALRRKISLSDIVYVGNDLNDLDCLKAVGCSVCVNDASPQVKRASKVILSQKGGFGAVRELIDLILNTDC